MDTKNSGLENVSPFKFGYFFDIYTKSCGGSCFFWMAWYMASIFNYLLIDKREVKVFQVSIPWEWLLPWQPRCKALNQNIKHDIFLFPGNPGGKKTHLFLGGGGDPSNLPRNFRVINKRFSLEKNGEQKNGIEDDDRRLSASSWNPVLWRVWRWSSSPEISRGELPTSKQNICGGFQTFVICLLCSPQNLEIYDSIWWCFLFKGVSKRVVLNLWWLRWNQHTMSVGSWVGLCEQWSVSRREIYSVSNVFS